MKAACTLLPVLAALVPAAAAAQIVGQCGTTTGNFDATATPIVFPSPTVTDFNAAYPAPGFVETTVTVTVNIKGNAPWNLCIRHDPATANLGPYPSGGVKGTTDLLVFSTVSGGWVPVPTTGYVIVHDQAASGDVSVVVNLRLLLRWEGQTDEPGTYGGTVEWVLSEY